MRGFPGGLVRFPCGCFGRIVFFLFDDFFGFRLHFLNAVNLLCIMLKYDSGSYPIKLLGLGRTERERDVDHCRR